MDNEEFSAKEHWKEFELLAVKVVSLIIDKTIVYDSIVENKVPITRDHGMDGHLIVTLQSDRIEVTVEAKLRSKGNLSLKDFATSILNYLLNGKDMHFIITNVEFTGDAMEVVNGLNNKYIEQIRCYDGYDLLDIMKQSPDIQQEYTAIYNNLLDKEFKRKTGIPKQGVVISEKKAKFFPLTSSRKAISANVQNDIFNGTKLIIVTGETGTGKSFVIRDAIKNTGSQMINIDMSYTTSLRIFAIGFIKSVVNIDIFQIVDCLSEEEKRDIENDIDHYDNSTDQFAKYLKQILNLNLTDDTFGYIIKSFIKSFIGRIESKNIIYIHNINKSTFETLTFLFQILDLFLAHDITVIIEAPDALDECPYLSEIEYHKILKELNSLKKKNPLSVDIHVNEFDEDEAAEFLKMFQLPNKHDYFINSVVNKYGYNPEKLRNIADYIISNHITTGAEILSMNIYDSGLIKLENILDYLHTKTYDEQNIIVFGLVVAHLLGNRIDLKLIHAINQKFKTFTTYKTLTETQWFYCRDNFLYVKKYISEKALHELSNIYNIQECALFLLENESIWKSHMPDYKYMECNLLYITGDRSFLTTANNTLEMLNRIQNNSIATLLLDKCRMFSLNIDILSNIKYSVMYLESLEPERFSERDMSALIENTQNKCILVLASVDKTDYAIGYEYLVRIKIIYYKKYRSLFDFFTAEKYIDEGLKLEDVYPNSKLMNRLYVYKALCIKERGFKDDFLSYFRKGIRKYPHESYIQICYCSNVSSYYFKRNRKCSRTYLRKGIKCAKKNGHKLMTVWLQHNLMICNLYDTNYDYNDFDAIYSLRRQSDKAGSIADISRSYNIEGCILMAQKQYKKAIKCFYNAVNLFNKNVTEQMIFLFRTNLIVALWRENESVQSEIADICSWLETTHERLFTKLGNAPVKSYENNYAAIISLIKLSAATNNTPFVDKLLSFFPFSELVNAYSCYKNNYKSLEAELNKLVDTCYIKNNDILILF